MFGSKLNYETHFFVSGLGGTPSARELSGIESLDIGYSNSAKTVNPLGYSKGVTAVGQATSQEVSFSRYLIYDDPILDFTGQEVMRGSINYDNNIAYGFESGYLTSYSVNCAVGSVPKVNASFVVYDELRSGVSASGTASTAILIPNQGSITATCDNSTTNRVLGFDYSIQVTKKPYYTIGRESPIEVKHIDPVNYTASVQMEVDDALMESGYSFLDQGKEGKSLSFTVKGRDGTTLQSLTIPRASLVSEQVNSSSNGSLRLTLNYVGHSS
jgi:hypothetical protein|tara:strand:+ start:2842 stop:3654 length:813 start_codon:yes stop_codon:yes gene_type:complete